ncbi:MAG: sulfotransferase [Pseudomonadota bacterium]
MFNSQAALHQAISHHQEGRVQKAEQIYQQILKNEPGNADALNLLGIVASQIGNYENAVFLITQAIQINSKKANYYNNLANALIQQGKIDKAVDTYSRALEINPNYAEAQNNLGVALKSKGMLDQAIAAYRCALAINPNYVEALDNLGSALSEQGKPDEAFAAYRRALEINPLYTEAYRHLTMLKRYVDYDDELQAMEELLERPDLNDVQRMHLYFGLGKAFEDLKEYETSFNFIREGNRIKRNTFSYAISENEVYFEKIKNTFDKKMFGRFSGWGSKDGTLIFIVGMPRSGSTLVEQILCSHRHVFGAGEINDLEEIITGSHQKGARFRFPDDLREFGREDIARFGTDYIRRIRGYSDGSKYITNKMLHNFLYIGLIKLALPNARIIHCKRFPADTCLSCFKTYFNGSHNYAYDLIELGKYYNLYQDLMSHWHDVLPGYIYDVHYEDLVTDQQNETRRLLEFCGLEWDEACLSFYKNYRPVYTASTAQVRRPMYHSSIRLWKKYEKQLEPLLAILEP